MAIGQSAISYQENNEMLFFIAIPDSGKLIAKSVISCLKYLYYKVKQNCSLDLLEIDFRLIADS